MLINNFVEPLLLAVVVETLIAWLFGFKGKKQLLAVVLVNLITNPLLNYLFVVNRTFNLFPVNFFVIGSLEVIVILVEWLILWWALKENPRKLFLLSCIMNFASYLVGVLILK
jgi:hypothetical protein